MPDKEDQIERALGAWDGVERARTDPYFATRAQARLNGADRGGVAWRWAPARLGLAGLLVLAGLNAWALSQRLGGETIDRPEELAFFVRSYSLENPTLYSP